MSEQAQEFTLETEQIYDGKILLHCSVNQWSHNIAKRLDAEVGGLFNRLASEGVTEVFTFSSNGKFCAYMGGTPIGVVEYNNEDHWIYKWELK